MTRVSLVGLSGIVAACAVPPSPRPPASGPVVASAPASSSPSAAPDASTPPRACVRPDLPAEFGERGVLRMPHEVWVRALAPVFDALCACGAGKTRLVLRVQPSEGEVWADAPEDASVDGCLKKRVAPGRFLGFAMPGSDCIDCGPRHLPTPAGAPRLTTPAPEPKPKGPVFMLPFVYQP